MFSNASPGASRELPDLIGFLQAVYRNVKGLSAVADDPSDAFVAWAKAYLAQHRPSEVFAVDNNCGVQLTNGQRLRISPDPTADFRPSGDMANPDTSIAIMQAR